MKTLTLFLLATIMLTGCGDRSVDERPSAVAATNSLLEGAVKDLLGTSTPVLRLAEPGMCPGHFDIRPSQVDALRRCKVLLRMDFQGDLDGKLSGARDGGLRIAEVRISGGLCEPESYLAACRQTADALIAAGLLDRPTADRRLVEIDQRIQRTAIRCRGKVEHLKGLPVLTSVHQKAFCAWLGLRPVAVFSGADTAGIGQVDRAVRDSGQEGVKVVIANLPEGRRVADALAERLGAKVVVFGNFPALNAGQSSFDDLLEANITSLVEAVGK